VLYVMGESADGKCSFCHQLRDADEKMPFFTIDGANENISICNSCIQDCINLAGNSSTYVEGSLESDICDICGESLRQIDQLFLRNEKKVCVYCIAYFVRVSLTVGKRPGVTTF
jgi:hypothetical protein